MTQKTFQSKFGGKLRRREAGNLSNGALNLLNASATIIIRMRIISLLSLMAGIFFHTAAWGQVPGLPAVDFQRYFPHLIAVSEEKQDKQYPNGRQYKFLTVRDQQEKVVIMTLIRREDTDRVVRVFLAKGPIENSEEILRGAVAMYSKNLDMKFEFTDLRHLRSVEDYQMAIGWEMFTLPK